MKRIKENYYEKPGQVIRRVLLPFDEIIQPNQETRSRNIQELDKFRQEIINENKMRQIKQVQRRKMLAKLNDPSYQEISFTQSVAQTIEKTLETNIRCFKPDEVFILLWNFLIAIAIAFNFLEIPLSLFLTDQVYLFQIENRSTIALNVIFIIALFFDMLIRLNLAFYRHGKLIIKRLEIVKHYSKYGLIIDFMGWLVYVIYIASHNHKLIYLKLLFYFKLYSLIKINSEIVFTLSIHRIRFCIYKLIRIIMLLWFITTWVSSIYFAIDYGYYTQKGYYYQTGQLWLTNSNSVYNINILESFPSWYVWYEYAAYWSFQTSSTVGYGDVTPRNPDEVLYCNFIILVNTIFFAFYINTIWQIISQLQENYNRYINNWGSLKQYLHSEGIPKEFNSKVGNFIQEMWINQNEGEGEEQEEFNNILSDDLKNEVLLSIRGLFFQKLPLFQEMSSRFPLQWSSTIQKLIEVIEKQKFSSGQVIFEYGQQSHSLYFLTYGKVGISPPRLQFGVQIQVNHHFGTEEFINQKNYLFNATALSFCVVWKLSRVKLISHLRQNPCLYTKYCEFRERIVFEEEIQLCNVYCAKCKSNKHFFFSCPQMIKWRNKVIRPFYGYKKLQRSQSTSRRRWKRKDHNSKKIINLFCCSQSSPIEKVAQFAGYKQKFNFTR